VKDTKTKKCKNISVSNSKYARAAAMLMLLSGIIRILYYKHFFHAEVDIALFFGQIILPLLCVFGFALFAFSNKTCPTILPAILGCIFFIIKALAFEPLHMVLCISMYALLGVLYTITVLGILPNKVPLIFAFALPLIIHIGMDIYEFATFKNIIIADYMPELSVILIMAALLVFSCSLKFKKVAN